MLVGSFIKRLPLLCVLLVPSVIECAGLDDEIRNLAEQIRDTQEVINYWEDMVDDPNIIFLEITPLQGLPQAVTFPVPRKWFDNFILNSFVYKERPLNKEEITNYIYHYIRLSNLAKKELSDVRIPAWRNEYRDLVNRREELEGKRLASLKAPSSSGSESQIDETFNLGIEWIVEEIAGDFSATGTWKRIRDKE